MKMVERKGIGHPDTNWDYIAEAVSVALSNYYLQEFGSIFHYNDDKALLVGGNSKPSFKGGSSSSDRTLYCRKGHHTLPEPNYTSGRNCILRSKRLAEKKYCFLDVEKHIQIIPKIRSGSHDLVELFQRFGEDQVPLANDTSFKATYFLYTLLEEKVLLIEKLLNSKSTKNIFPFIGEDVKIMGFKVSDQLQFKIAISLVDQLIAHIEHYKTKITQAKTHIRSAIGLSEAIIYINTTDNYAKESLSLTVTGTSAESRDDGQAGRGNQINGLMTPYRLMSLEATAQKNPISHIGKIYNLFAFELSKAVYEMGYAEEVTVFIVSQISKPITKPQVLDIRVIINRFGID